MKWTAVLLVLLALGFGLGIYFVFEAGKRMRMLAGRILLPAPLMRRSQLHPASSPPAVRRPPASLAKRSSRSAITCANH